MCGISAVIGNENVVDTLYESIRNLEYRGYDSCGLSMIRDDRIEVRKNTGGVEEVNHKERLTAMRGCIGIAHTRWATHGKVTAVNAHPHLSFDNRFSIVHNGIINNFRDLREELEDGGVTFISETDTEVLVHLIATEYAESGNVEEAFLAAIRRLEGSYAAAMITSVDSSRIFAVKMGSPLVLGLDHGMNFIASDVNAFLP